MHLPSLGCGILTHQLGTAAAPAPLLFLKRLVSSSLPPGSPGTVRTRARASCRLRSVGVQLPHGSCAGEKLWSQVGRGRGRRRVGQTGGLGACLSQLPSQESPVFSLMAFHVANIYQAWGLPGCSGHSRLAQRLLAPPTLSGNPDGRALLSADPTSLHT